MTIIANQFNWIFNKHYSNSSADVIVNDSVAFKLCDSARLSIITEIMYRKDVDEGNLPGTFESDLDEFGYTISGMLEWTTAKIQTLIDDFVDIDADNPRCEEGLRNKLAMVTDLKSDMSIYMKLKILVEKEQLYRNQLKKETQTILSSKADKCDASPYYD